MKTLLSVGCRAVALLPAVVLTILPLTGRADIFPTELLAEQATMTNFGSAEAISGDTLMVQGVPDAGIGISEFKRVNGVWHLAGDLEQPPGLGYLGSYLALSGNTLVVGDGSGPRAYILTNNAEPALNAWNTSDNTSGGGVYYRYGFTLSSNALAQAASEGWTLTVRSRLATDFAQGSVASCFVDFGLTSTNRFLMFFNLDNSGNLEVQLNSGSPIVLTTNGLGWLAYHTHQFVYDPTNGSADYYFDGVKMNSSPLTPQPVAVKGVRFGNGSTSGLGSMNFNLVELRTRQTDQVLASYNAGTAGNPTVAPDPATQGWSLLPDNTGTNSSQGPVSPDLATEWQLQATPTLPNSLHYQSLGLQGDTLVLGAVGDSTHGANSGAAFVFARNGTIWTQQQKLLPSVYAANDQFGAAVAIDGDTLVIGAPNYYASSATGRAFVFVRNGTNWTQQSLLVATNAAAGDEFGGSVAIDGDRVAIGALYDDQGANAYAGSVYIFDRSGTTWSQQGRMVPNDYLNGEAFGAALALKGDLVVAGGPYYQSGYVFALGPTGWVQATNFVYSEPGARQASIDGQTIVVSQTPIEVGDIAVHVYVPSYTNATAVANYVGQLLYYPNAASSPLFDPNQAAFRYKTLLYAQGANGVFAQYTNMANLYGQPERDRADYAESELEKGLALNPDDAGLGNLLLDICYDRSEAETILANNLLAQADAARFPSAISGQPTPPSGFVIDNEIPLYEQALATNEFALKQYFSLFTNNLGLAESPPLGYQIFTNLVPTRGLMPATYLDTNGVAQPVTSNNAALFNGYKDLALLFDGLHRYGDTAVTLGKLLLAREGSGDSLEASNVLGSAQQLLFLNGAFLRGLFATLPGTNDPSALAQSINGWSASLTALNTLEQNLTGGANLLGFAPDFLMYVYSLPGQPAGIFNSYDALYTYLDPGNPNNGSHPLSLATSALQAAEGSYTAYRGYQDQYADQMTFLNQNYLDRLRDIVGVYPGDPSYGDDPTNNPGSELDQQFQIIQQAKLKMVENQTEVSSLLARVKIEVNRAASVSSVVIKYGNMNAKITEEIGHIAAAQSFLNGVSDTVGTIGQLEETAALGVKAVSIIGGLNAIAQGFGEEEKGQLEAQQERNAALQQATIEGIDSAAAVKTMMLDMNTLLVESQEAALQVRQAVSQLVGLYREKEQLENQLAQQNASLAARYYADPIHRLLAQSDMVAANQQFANAQRWLFFMERALAYKWNAPLDHAYAGITWTEDTLFKLRNADELNEMFNAMNDWDALLQATLAATQTNVDYFSVRDDFFGYALTNSLGQQLTYADPITGQTVDGIQAFRDRLRQLLNSDDPNNTYIDLPFSTVRQVPGKPFFQGPVFSSNGTLISRGLCLDKIQWIKINLPGPHTFGGSSLQGTLTYGGTSFIRNLIVGTYDPLRPDRLMNEMTAYSTRRWYFSPAQDVFTSEEAQTTSASMQLSTQAGVVPAGTEIDVFNERSVATSGWDLTIPITVSGTPVLSIDQLDDIEIWFKHIATDRITQ